MYTFSFNGRSLLDFGAVMRQRPTYNIAVRDINLSALPYRSGDEINDSGRYKNISFSIPIRTIPPLCALEPSEFSRTLSDWLIPGNGNTYRIYRDTYNLGFYRKAVITDIDPVVAVKRDVLETKITFNADPFLYSDAGLTPVVFTADNTYTVSESLTNPFTRESLPIIKITGSGDFSCIFGGHAIIANDVEGGIVFDSPRQEIYDLTGAACNGLVSTIKLPVLMPGANQVYVTSEAAFSVEVTPNWRRL